MPYKSEKIKIEFTKHDRRLKLTEEERDEIVFKHENGQSQRSLAREYQVDRKTIYNTVYPKKYQQQLKNNKKNKHWDKYYNREYNTKKVREHRRYKHKLYSKGKIKEDE